METHNEESKNVLKIIMNGVEYKLPTAFAKTSELLSSYVCTKETLFIYDDKEVMTIFLKYWDKYTDNFIIKLYEDLQLDRVEFLDLSSYIRATIPLQPTINIKNMFKKLEFFGYANIAKAEKRLDAYLDTKRTEILDQFTKYLTNIKDTYDKHIFKYDILHQDIKNETQNPFSNDLLIHKLNILMKKNILQATTVHKQFSSRNMYHAKFKKDSHIYTVTVNEEKDQLEIQVFIEIEFRNTGCMCW